jgi:hypothetical protein
MVLCLVALALSFMTACSQEPDPDQQPVKPDAAVSQSSTKTTKPAVEEVKKKVDETVSVVKAEVAEQVEVVKKQAADVVDQTRASVVAVVDTVEKSTVPAMKTIALEMKGPDLVSYDASKGKVTFNHTDHSTRLACSECHTIEPPQKIVINMETAHVPCKGCHKGASDAPTSCSGCHLK